MSARPAHPLHALGGRLLEAVLERVVSLDPATRERLAVLDGRAVRVAFAPAGPALRIVVAGSCLRVGPADAGESALHLRASPSALLAVALARGREGALPPGRVEIAGDAELARRLEQIATRFAPDVDAAFARVFGDVAGFQLARALREGLAGARRTGRAAVADTVEFLREESRDVVGRAELGGFLDDVDALRERADRLDARVRRVEALAGRRA